MKLPFSYYNSKGEAAFLLVMVLLVIIGACRLLASAIHQAEGSSWLLVVFLCLISSLLLWPATKLARRLVGKNPRLTLTETGVTDHLLGIGEVCWTDIEGAYVRSVRGNAFICLNLRNENAYVARMVSTTRLSHSFNNTLGFTAVSFGLNGIDAKTEEVLAAIKSLSLQIS